MTDTKSPYNAGQTVEVSVISRLPIQDVNHGTITVHENWGRLFIRSGRGEVVVMTPSAYPDLVAAIQHFIEPDKTKEVVSITTDTSDKAIESLSRAIKILGCMDRSSDTDITDQAKDYMLEASSMLTALQVERNKAKEIIADHHRLMEEKTKVLLDAINSVKQHDGSLFSGSDAEKNRRSSWRGVMRKIKAIT